MPDTPTVVVTELEDEETHQRREATSPGDPEL